MDIDVKICHLLMLERERKDGEQDRQRMESKTDSKGMK